jgi:hypothetical protein
MIEPDYDRWTHYVEMDASQKRLDSIKTCTRTSFCPVCCGLTIVALKRGVMPFSKELLTKSTDPAWKRAVIKATMEGVIERIKT